MNVTTRTKTARFIAAMIVSSTLATGGAKAEEGIRYAQTREGERPTSTVAVDSACAWPNLTVLRDGTIVAMIHNSLHHGNVPADVECWGTTDNGKTWQKFSTAAPHEPHTNRMNVAAGLANNGDLLLIASGWSHKSHPGQPKIPGKQRILDPWLCRSSDGGRTWTIDKEGMPNRVPDKGNWIVPFGDILADDDGVLHVGIYGATSGPPYDD
ncbi:hypothetical protein LCGC14_2144180, partial [marine sediment metagenome]